MTPRLNVTSVALFSPVTFRTEFSFSLPFRYSATVTSMPTFETSENPASTPSVPVPRSTRKLNCAYGRSRLAAMSRSLSRSLLLCVARPLADPEDHELGRLQRRDADQADEAAVVEVVLRQRRPVAPDEVRRLGLVAEQRSHLELVEEEVRDGAADVRPQRLSVRLEHGPLRAPVDRVLEVREVPADVDVLPL